MTPITVGVPYRDDGQDFSLVAGGLRQALLELPAGVPVELLICVNGSGENAVPNTAGIIEAVGITADEVRIITSGEGKLAAMARIAGARTLGGYLAFVDSDVVLAPNVLRLLWETLEGDPACVVSYGQPVPVFPGVPNLIHRLTRVHYALRDRAYRRPYFHGRAFMLRQWFLDPPNFRTPTDSKVASRLALARGPLVDDIAMSRMAVARWGTSAIREVQAANVYFDPPDDLRGLYAGALRVALEIQRLDLLYPEHAAIQHQVFEAAWHPTALHRFSWRLRLMHAAYRTLEALLKVLARCHVRLVKAGWLRIETTWIRVPGTKQFARHRRAWQAFSRGASAPRRTPASTVPNPPAGGSDGP